MFGALLLASVAYALPFRFTPTEGAVPQVLPVVEPGRAEILVRGNRADLRRELGVGMRDGLRAWRVSDLGESWVITVWLQDPSDTFSLREDAGAWYGVVEATDRAPLPALAPAPATRFDEVTAVDASVGGCDEAHGSALVPLHGADMLHAFSPEDFAATLPRWTEAEHGGASWDRIADLRGDLPLARSAAERAIRLYALGAAHRELGHDREAAYYFGRAQAAGAPDGHAAIQRAGALLRSRQWDAAKEAAREAVGLGASEDAALEIVAISGLNGGVAAAPVARALAARTSRPQAQLIAGGLLMRAGCFAEASVALRRAMGTRALGSEHSLMATVLLADALVLVGESRGAAELLGGLDTELSARWRPLVRSRSRLLAMLSTTPDQWPTFVPTLTKRADHWDAEGSEALFLLGQVGAALGDSRMANDALGALVDRNRGFAAGEPGRMLLEAWDVRVRELLGAGRSLDALAFHGGTWRRSLLPHVGDPSLLRDVARAYILNGLYDEAIAALADVASIEGASGLDDRETALSIADAYRRSGRYAEALDTLEFLARRERDENVTPRAQMLLARTREDAGQLEQARAVYRRLERSRTARPLRAEARLRGAMLDARAGRCEEALPALLPASIPDDLSMGVLGMVRARCLWALGRGAEARAAAEGAGALLTDPEVQAWAEFFATLGLDRPAGVIVSAVEPAPPVSTAPTTPADGAAAPAPAAEPPGQVWRWLADEERAHDALQDRVRATTQPARRPLSELSADPR